MDIVYAIFQTLVVHNVFLYQYILPVAHGHKLTFWLLFA